MIPKKIHYCWFGRNPKPKLAEDCIKSWRKYCKDYEIIEWNEDNFDITSAPLYVRQAYETKKWAFVTDYVRLWALVQYGGIYMDTDVEVIRSLDVFLKEKAFSGFEAKDRIPTGILASEKGFALFDALMHEYDNISFVHDDGSFDMTTNVTRITKRCVQCGLALNNTYQIIDGFALYPQSVFCPKSGSGGKIYKTKDTYTIHHFMGSWASKKQKKHWKKYANSSTTVVLWDRFLSKCTTSGRKVLGDTLYEKVKNMFSKGK